MTPALPEGFRHEWLQTKDVRLHWVRGGAGPTVVLLHGWPQCWYEWRALLPRFATSYQVIAVDLRGMGASSKPADGFDNRTMAEDVAAVLESLAVQRYAVAAHDIAVPVGYALASEHPNKVTAFVALEAVLPGISADLKTNESGSPLWHPLFHAVLDLPELLLSDRERAYLSYFFRTYAANPEAITPDDLEVYTQYLREPGALRASLGYFRSIETIAQNNAQYASRKLRMPVLALGGDRSLGEFGLATMQQVAEHVQGDAVADCGHWVVEEQPEELFQRMEPFLNEVLLQEPR